MSDQPPSPPAADIAHDWLGLFHLYAFLSLTLADRRIERRELVWIRRFLAHRGLAQLEPLLQAALQEAEKIPALLAPLLARARAELPQADKRRLVYDMAQLCKSKGALADAEYDKILELAQQLGLDEVEADSIVNSVYSVNDTFTAVLGVLALGFILWATKPVIVPLVVAVFVTMIINKVEGLVSRGLKVHRLRWLNKAVAMVVILGAMGLLGMATVASARDIGERLPYYQDKAQAALGQVQQAAAAYGLPGLDWSYVIERVKGVPIGGKISGFLGSLFSLLGNFFLVVVFTGFLVFSGGGFSGILQEMNDKVSDYISIKTVVSLLTGAGVLVACLVFGVDFPLFWAILTFALNYIPSLGSIIATIPPIAVAAIQLGSPGAVVAFGLSLAALQVAMGNVLEPKLMGNKLAIKPIAILLGLIFWGFLWGLPGMFLAAPLMVFTRILASYYNFSRSIERLLAAE